MWLLIGDTHFTDNARDQHRFGIFNWIKLQQDKRPVAATFLAGDLCDAKDRHSATLVNQVVAGLTKLRPPVYICRGNHDYKDPENPYFNFLNQIEGLSFVNTPSVYSGMAIIPHYREQEQFDEAIKLCCQRGHVPSAYLVHQTFDGAIAESGTRLSGLSASPIELLQPSLGVYAGDVHKPQTQGIVTYVGCPYQVRFGDNFKPRALWVTEDADINLYYPAPRKWSLQVSSSDDLFDNEKLIKGDQVKLTIKLDREESVYWKRIKQDVLAACREMQLEVFGVSMEVTAQAQKRITLGKERNHDSTFKQFAKNENLPAAIVDAGQKLLES